MHVATRRKENFTSALQRIEVRVNAGWHESMGVGREPGVVKTGAEVAVYILAGTRAEWHDRLLSLAQRAHERQVAGGRVGPRQIPVELGSVLFMWVGCLDFFY
jgi:hypothetical protein